MYQRIENIIKRNVAEVMVLNFLYVLKEDLKRAFSHTKYRYIIVLLMIIALILIPANISNTIYERTTEFGKLGFFDYLFYMLSGAELFITEKIDELEIPIAWMAMQFFCSFLIFDYVYYDLKGVGRNVLIKSKSKFKWWFSKCICTCTMVISVYGILFVSSLVVTLFSSGDSKELHMKLIGTICELEGNYEANKDMMVYLILVPLIVSISISLFQMLVSQWVKPVLSMVVIMSVSVFSVYSNSKLLWGNWSMILRSDLCVADGVPGPTAVILALILGVIGSVVGGIAFCKRDVI